MVMAVDYAGLMQPVALALLGEPNRSSSRTELRYGTHDGLSIDLEKGVWFDHDGGENGGLLALVTRCTGRPDGKQWLVEQGFLDQKEVQRAPSPAAVYDYADENGEILFQVVRKEGRKFRQRRPDGTWSVKGVRQVPYRLPELIAASPDTPVFVAEGEKDVDNVRALGLVATCNAGGAGKWRPHHAKFLQGRDVVILPDNDEAGRKHAEQVRESLAGIARSVRMLELPDLPAKGDVSDWIVSGGTRDALMALLAGVEGEGESLRRVSLDGLMAEADEDWPHVVEYYFPRRVVTLLGGHGGVGKSMLALIFAAHVAAGRPWGALEVEQGSAVFLSFEDDAVIVRSRLRRVIRAYELPADTVTTNLAIFDGSDAEAELAIEDPDGVSLAFTPMMGLVAGASAGSAFVVIDNASDTFGANENARRQVRRFIRRLAQEAKANDAAVVLLAHIDKASAKSGGKGNNFSGSTAWHNSVRSRLALVETDEAGIELLHEKANYGPRQEPVHLRRGLGGVLEQVAPEAAAAAQESARMLTTKADADAVLGVMEALIANRITIPTAETGQRTTYHVLSRAEEMPQQYRTAAGKERVKTAIQALEREGRIVRELYRKPDRKDGERWALPQKGGPEAVE